MERWTRHLRRLGYALVAAALGIALGCSTMQIAGEIFDSAVAFGKQRTEQASFLGTSTGIFYPEGVPADVSVLPKLSDRNIQSIQQGLDVQTTLLLRTVRKERILLSSLVGREVSDVKDQKFIVEQGDAPTLALSESGVITLDSRVLQAIYRGVVVSATRSWVDGCKPAGSNECERRSLALLIAAREQFLKRSPITTVNEAKEVAAIAKARPGTMEELRDVMMQRLDENMAAAGAEMLSIEASTRYDDALLFIVAHELGHRVLNHYARASNGERRYDLELEADRFAALASTLTRNQSVRPRNPVLRQSDGEMYEMTSVGPCPGKYNHEPTGHRDYFEFGYPLSGFPSIGSDYPPREARNAVARAVTQASISAISLVQRQKGLCDGGMPKGDLAAFLEENHAYRTKEVQEWRVHAVSKDARGDPEYYKRVIQMFEDLISERKIGDRIYLEYMGRI